MPLTPEDVAARRFQRVLRGYSADEVDAFLDEVESELGRLAAENAALREQVVVTPGGGDLEVRRAELEREVEELAAFEREYRTRLRAYLEEQLRELGAGA